MSRKTLNPIDRWPRDEFGRFGRQFNRYLAPHSAKLAQLSSEVKSKKHPWGYILVAVIAASIFATIKTFDISEGLGLTSGAIGAVASFLTGQRYHQKDKVLKHAMAKVDDYVSQDIMPLDYINTAERDPDIVNRFQAFGVFGAYDDVKTLHGIIPKSNKSDDALTDPLFTYAHLTREETETYRDSKGRTQTRTRTVNVFKGLLLDMPFPDAEGPYRTLITTKHARTPKGPFERHVRSKRLKMEKIKTSSLTFHKKFNVLADDPVLSHAILDPDRVMRFINLHEDLITQFGKHADIIMLIMDGRMWVGVETGEFVRPSKTIGNTDKLKPALQILSKQLSTRHIIASHLKLPQELSFPWQISDDTAET